MMPKHTSLPCNSKMLHLGCLPRHSSEKSIPKRRLISPNHKSTFLTNFSIIETMTTVENRLNNPVPTRAADAAAVADVDVNVKIEVNVSNAKKVKRERDDDDDDVVVDEHHDIEIPPEADEEIDSEVEGADYEDKMLQAALANSVADHQKIQANKIKQEENSATKASPSSSIVSPPTRAASLRVTAPESGPSASDASDPNESTRYGLRKRRRQKHKDDSDDDQCSDGALTPRAGVGTKKRATGEESPSSRRGGGRLRQTGDEGTKIQQEPPNQKSKSASKQGTAPSSTKSKKRAPKTVTPAGTTPGNETRKTGKRTSHVPNPLLSSSAISGHNNSASSKGTSRPLPGSLSVPCPLPAVEPVTSSQAHESMPAPAPVAMDSGLLHQRPRVFSVDLDPSTFDFSDLGSELRVKNEVDTNALPPQPADDLQLFPGRDRAFSFEVFNFSGDDDLLHSTGHSVEGSHLTSIDEGVHSTRPRGDSIIFDPCSFQDGGIHEQNALDYGRVDELQHMAPLKDSSMHPHRQHPTPCLLDLGSRPPSSSGGRGRGGSRPSSRPVGRPKSRGSHSNQGPPPGISAATAAAASSGEMVTLPSILSMAGTDGGAGSDPSNPPSFQMDLLNKDGRVGIYLPEARKARIARFHAKRKMRIWRKRIKYDCRKKLADSRPRIKGRFVKRSDVDDNPAPSGGPPPQEQVQAPPQVDVVTAAEF
mmetsp:Transcript_11809/g.28295  ORF Transcript_11809/g.28295 Transcript_11809/m.28295 type:complete len:705 (-) Transcript_11809:572-2686(-)